MTIGERIKAARKQAGMTQQELAEKLNISYVGISQWESGRRNPKESTLVRIAEVLDVPVAYLTGSHLMSTGEIADFVNRAWPRVDDYLKTLREDGGDTAEIERWERVCVDLNGIRAQINEERQVEQVTLTEQESHLLDIFRGLNYKGRQKVLAILNDYAKIKDYSVDT